eukprot:4122593-Ditylum_brightwellii.AAC.1
MDLDEGEVSPSSDTNPTKQCWVLEMERAKPKTKGKDNKKEFLAEQEHHNCICTADCTDVGKAERDQANDDSGCESDWYSHTCIRPGGYRACKAAETKLKAQRSNSKRMKRSY